MRTTCKVRRMRSGSSDPKRSIAAKQRAQSRKLVRQQKRVAA